ncbi:MAG: site-specific DNA-methyltransferase [Candidatus Paceibacterota bacterium]|jgi:site-specific DNA-methyltransferase (adenine-specific)/adenine-specific DNA-methyltransferase
MSLKLSKQQKEKILRLVEKNEDLPDGYKNLLFPNQKKEYELVYAGKDRKEDIIAETMAVPFQQVKTFGKNENGWTNKLIFGDNLQVLKEIYNDQRDKNLLDTKDKIKLIYIDPPFATKQDFMKDGEKVYQDKVIGAEFLEFLRERLILANEILASDGFLFVHLDGKKGHYAKVLLDEIFGENNFVNEIIWRYFMGGKSINFFSRKHDNIFVYKKSENSKLTIKTRERILDYKPNMIDENSKIKEFKGVEINSKEERFFYTSEVKEDDVWEISGVFNMSGEYTDYPTQKPEALLERIIKASSAEGDIVMDFFAGSGTTLASAEKLNRKWIGCDCGKLSIYTIQKRILNIAFSKDLVDKNKKYGKKNNPFTLYNAGLYDYNKIKELPWDEYRAFALNLFEVRDEVHKLSGIELDGFRGNDHTIVFNHEKYKKAVLDYGFIDDLHKNLGPKISDKFFIIAPAGNVDFLEDYVEKGKIRYYILRIPYSIINELHNRDFENIKQPVDEQDVNNTVEAVGFDFIQTPEVDCEYKGNKKELLIKIKKFKSRIRSKKPIKYKDKETLSMVMVDFNYNGEVFDLDKTYFAENLKKDGYKIKFEKKQLDKKMMIIYMDIFGNEKKEIKELKDFK